MSTQWDSERLRAKVESWEPRAGQQIGLGQQHGLVVRVYDHGPADGRSEKGSLVFDSEVAHGSAGVFGAADEARAFADRIEEALLVRAQWCERIQHERREGLDAAQGERFRVHDQAKQEAAEANARAKQAQKEIRQLRDEAASPTVTIECPLRGDGYRVVLAPSLTDGTHEEAEGRTLANTIPDPKPKSASRRRHGPAVERGPKERSPIDDALDATEEAKPKRGRGKKAPPRPEAKPKLPEHVPDVSGLPLRVGSRVEIPGIGAEGRVTAILRQDPDGAFIVEIEDDVGIPHEVASAECSKIEGRESDDPDWPE